MSDYRSRKNQYFVPGDGIAREVITADICKYLDNDATVRPMNYQGREGFMLYAYRNLTSAMIEDLKKDTTTWEKEQRDKRPRGTSHRDSGHGALHRKRGYEPSPDIDLAYVDSRTHQRRQDIGPTVPETPSPSHAEAFPPGGRGPPPGGLGYQQQASPQHEQNYPMQRGSGPYPGSTNPGSFPPSYPTAMDTSYPSRPSNDFGGYPPNNFGAPQQPQMNGPGRAYPPQPSQTAPPGVLRDSRDPRYNDFSDPRDPRDPRDTRDPRDVRDPRDPRIDPRGIPQADPRQFQPDRVMDYGRPPVDPRAGYDPRFQDTRYRR